MIKCETCKFWKPPTEGNVGQCRFLLANKKAPFWAEDILSRTISWQGKACGAWEKARKKWVMK